MKNSTNKLFAFAIVAVTIIFTAVSCKSGKDSNEAIADSIQAQRAADSVLQMKSMQDNSVKADMINEGTAQPNPVKKGGKGMVVFQEDRSMDYDKNYATITIEMDKEGIYNRTEIRPSYPGGQKALSKFIKDNIMYPETAIENGVEGNVDVVFAVDENGKVYTPMIKGDKAGYGLDEASLEVVNKMPKWNPGQIKGKNVKSYYTLPISFKIN